MEIDNDNDAFSTRTDELVWSIRHDQLQNIKNLLQEQSISLKDIRVSFKSSRDDIAFLKKWPFFCRGCKQHITYPSKSNTFYNTYCYHCRHAYSCYRCKYFDQDLEKLNLPTYCSLVGRDAIKEWIEDQIALESMSEMTIR